MRGELNALRDRVLEHLGRGAFAGGAHVGYSTDGTPFISTADHFYVALHDEHLGIVHRTAGRGEMTVITPAGERLGPEPIAPANAHLN